MPKFNHSTPAQLGALLRERYRTGSGARIGNIATWLLTRTNAELQTWFGLTASQATALRTRLTSRVNALTTLRNQVGE